MSDETLEVEWLDGGSEGRLLSDETLEVEGLDGPEWGRMCKEMQIEGGVGGLNSEETL